jgi:hypothetical protein
MGYEKYREAIIQNLCLNSNEWNFKKNRYYNDILEHVSNNQGYDYLQYIINKFNLFYTNNKNYLIEICNQNDLYGQPNKTYFNDFCECSPTNLRYILHSLLILEYCNKINLTDIDFVEIGGGYGGLAFFLYKLAKIYNITIKSYIIFDLPEPMILQKKYLNLHNIDINTLNIYDDININKNSFLISNYAYSEISHDLQQLYTNKVINPYISHGFMVWNFIEFYNFCDNKNFIKENEYPLTGTNNYYIYF